MSQSHVVSAAWAGVSADERRLIGRIVERALRDYPRNFTARDRMDIEMDLHACHGVGCPLDLQRLLDSPRGFDFAHDIFGIRANLDRDTGRLNNLFRPRFAKQTRRVVAEMGA